MTINVKSSEWHDGAARWLIPACGRFLPISYIRKAVQRGDATLFDVIKDGEHRGSFVAVVDDTNEEKEIVVLAAGGDMPGDSAYKISTKFVEAIAIHHCAKYVRGHTSNAAVGRMMEAAGFELSELVYRKKVDYGQGH